MSKRFIDTGLFDDDWFMDLSKDAKLLWVYLITKCDHAGTIKLNEKLCKVQTDVKDLDGVIKQLGNRLVTVSEHLYFIPKFIEFQYPKFPNSKVRQQNSAIEILVKYGLFDRENLTVIKQLGNGYEHEHDTDNGTEGGMGEKPKLTPEEEAFNFYAEEAKKAKEYTGQLSLDYVTLCNHICLKNADGTWRMPFVLRMKNQLSLNDFSKLYEKAGKNLESITSRIDSLQTNVKYHGKYTDIYLTINKWLNNK
jgi:hypothetical protein